MRFVTRNIGGKYNAEHTVYRQQYSTVAKSELEKTASKHSVKIVILYCTTVLCGVGTRVATVEI